MKTYAAYYDNKVRFNSSSGGVFSLFASQFDVIYGVAMTNDCMGCEFIRVVDDITPLRGSKYIQAKVGDIFKQVKKDLEEGKEVLFTGTGCQINGLYMFLGKEYPNLFLLDVVCHGTPSPKLWRKYVHFQEEKMGDIIAVNFRCKNDGWKEFGMKENQLFVPMRKDIFMRMFLRNYCLRPACYECHAKNYKKSDMSIADFWGIEDVAPELNDGMGVSAIFIRSNKGQELFDFLKDRLKWQEVSYEAAVKQNPCEYESVARPPQRNTFFYDLDVLSFGDMEKKYASDIKISAFRKMVLIIKCTIKKMKDLCGGGEKIKM